MPFGLVHGPGTFQRYMNKMLVDFENKGVFVYLYDILIFSKSMNEHEQH